MKKLILLSLLSISFLKAKHHEPKSQDEAIKIISEGDNPAAMLIFINGCGHCERIKPIFKGLADQYSNVDFIAVEYSNVDSLVKKHKIQGFPHILYFKANSACSHDSTQGANDQELREKVENLSKNN